MTVQELCTHYVALKQSLGMRFHTECVMLTAFCKSIGPVDLRDVTPEAVRIYLDGTGPTTSFWQRKYQALSGVFRFALSRGYLTCSPLPVTCSLPAVPFIPHIFSRQELASLLHAIEQETNVRTKLQPDTIRTIFLLLYGTGLRLGEMIALTEDDVDLITNVLLIRQTKFYKTRYVPIGTRLATVLATYAQGHGTLDGHSDQRFFRTRDGQPVTHKHMDRTFRRLCRRAGVQRQGGTRMQPRLHDLRHTFAVHRLIAWYAAGQDVQLLLPKLSTYLGHINIAATQTYLTMTPELLDQASGRFERYMEALHD